MTGRHHRRRPPQGKWRLTGALPGWRHQLGVAKGIDLVDVSQLAEPIGVRAGAFWLLAAVLVLSAAALLAGGGPTCSAPRRAWTSGPRLGGGSVGAPAPEATFTYVRLHFDESPTTSAAPTRPPSPRQFPNPEHPDRRTSWRMPLNRQAGTYAATEGVVPVWVNSEILRLLEGARDAECLNGPERHCGRAVRVGHAS